MEFATHTRLLLNRIIQAPQGKNVTIKFKFCSDFLRLDILQGSKVLKGFKIIYMLSMRYLRKIFAWLFPLRIFTMRGTTIDRFIDFLEENLRIANDYSLRFIFLEEETIIRIAKYEFVV